MSGEGLRVVAVLAVRNEERFVADCLENLFRQGVQVYLCDNQSTDRTVEIAESYRGRGLIGVETIPHDGVYYLERLLRRKEELFQLLDADWLMHVDADEIHLPPRSHSTLAAAFADADARGYDTVETSEFTFVPTREAPDHDHPDFQRTLRSYYPFRPRSPHCVRALKKRAGPMEIAWSGGHRVRFASEPRLYPEPCLMRHYQFLSEAHAVRKYVNRRFDDDAVIRRGWHGWRPLLRPEDIQLPPATELRTTATDADLDAAEPWTKHWLDRCVAR
ncbi:MAG: glycosyltransferase family A protein [Betaproteobacteria bacterium]